MKKIETKCILIEKLTTHKLFIVHETKFITCNHHEYFDIFNINLQQTQWHRK
jgi:hypothetical protein